MLLERSIHSWHHLFNDALLDVDGFEEAGEAGAEDGVHGVCVVQTDEGGVDAFGFEVA